MEFSELIHKRESVRNYDPKKPVSREILEKILEAGRIAPSASNYQPWEFWVLSSPEILAKVKASYSRSWLQDAPAILVVTGDLNDAWERSDGYNSLQTDLAIAMYQMILAATDMGVSTCWVTNFDPNLLRQALNLKDSVQVYGITPLGYPKPGFIKREVIMRKPIEDMVTWR